MQQSATPSLAAPEGHLVALAIVRLALMGLHPIDRRNGIALLSLIGAGFEPTKLARSPRGAALAAQIGLDLAGWGRVLGVLEQAGLVTAPGRNGRRSVAQ